MLEKSKETEVNIVVLAQLLCCLLRSFDVSSFNQEFVLGDAELIDAIPEKRRLEDGGYSSSDGEEVI